MEETTAQNPAFESSVITPMSDQPDMNPANQPVKAKILTGLGALVLLAVVGVVGYFLGQMNNRTAVAPSLPEEGVACTLDAKICPDGSSVGRVGPNCEFAECPGLPFGYSSDKFVSLLSEANGEKLYGVFDSQLGQQECVEHYFQYQSPLMPNKLEVFKPCVEDMYTVTITEGNLDSFLNDGLPKQNYKDAQNRIWNYSETEVEGQYRVIAQQSLASSVTPKLEVGSWIGNGLTPAQVLALAEAALDGFASPAQPNTMAPKSGQSQISTSEWTRAQYTDSGVVVWDVLQPEQVTASPNGLPEGSLGLTATLDSGEKLMAELSYPYRNISFITSIDQLVTYQLEELGSNYQVRGQMAVTHPQGVPMTLIKATSLNPGGGKAPSMPVAFVVIWSRTGSDGRQHNPSLISVKPYDNPSMDPAMVDAFAEELAKGLRF